MLALTYEGACGEQNKIYSDVFMQWLEYFMQTENSMLNMPSEGVNSMSGRTSWMDTMQSQTLATSLQTVFITAV